MSQGHHGAELYESASGLEKVYWLNLSSKRNKQFEYDSIQLLLADLKKDIELLVSQVDRCNDILKRLSINSTLVDRCNDILKRLSINSTLEDDFIGKDLSLNNYLKEIINSFKEISDKNFIFNIEQDTNSFDIKKSIEIIYGIRNFIGNANKYAMMVVILTLL